MQLLTVARVMAVVAAGLFAGILLGDRAGATYARPQLPLSAFVQFQQIQHTYFGRMMPPLIMVAIFAALVWLILLRARAKEPEFWLVGAATAGLAFCFVRTLLVNVPLNDQLMTWSIEDPPANVRELWAVWERAHTIRTVFASGAFLFEVVALGLAGQATVGTRGTTSRAA